MSSPFLLLSPPKRQLSRGALVAALCAQLFLLVGCAAEGAPPAYHQNTGGAGGEGGARPGPGPGPTTQCTEGAKANCTVYVEQAGGITSCWKGVKFCVDGAWTECLDPSTEAPDPSGAK